VVDRGFLRDTRRALFGCTAAAAALLIIPTTASAVGLEQIGSFSSPTYMTSDPADPDRIFVVEQDGRIQLTANGSTSTFLDLDAIVLSAGEPGGSNEQGMLSMAFAPDYATSARFYVAYTDEDGVMQVDELTASGDSADASTRKTVMTVPHSDDPFHYGGQLQFGPDGQLYVSTGDAARCCSDPYGNAQNLGSLSGKLLRISPQPGGGYTVPADNPFIDVPGAQPEIWSLGLRNPWRFSFDRATGALALTDVGQFAWEEVNYRPLEAGRGRGDNFGWPCWEGPAPGLRCPGAFTDPVFSYPHDGDTCAITGGYVVRDPGLPQLSGRYVYADFCAGEIRSVAMPPSSAFDDCSEEVSVERPTSFGEDADGRVYVVSRAGPVYRLVDGSPPDCESPPPAVAGPPAAEPEQQGGGPVVGLGGKDRQSLSDKRRVRVLASVAEQSTLELDAVVLDDGGELFHLPTRVEELAPGVTEKIAWKLSRADARRARNRIRGGERVMVRFGGYAAGAEEGAGSAAQFEARLVLE
jgi:glucose/arabinose dehydrogenase